MVRLPVRLQQGGPGSGEGFPGWLWRVLWFGIWEDG